MSDLDRSIDELRDAAAKLRQGELEPQDAAALVDRCAEMAAEIGAALDRQARDARAEPPPGQETLLG